MSEHNFSSIKAKVVAINGNLITGFTDSPVAMNEVVFVVLDEIDKKRGTKRRLKAEIIRIRGSEFDAQVFEDTVDIRVGFSIDLSRELLSIELGPGLLGTIFDGLGNPLNQRAQLDGLFLKRGSYIDTIDKEARYHFTPIAKINDILVRGQTLGIVQEGNFDHRIMVPFSKLGSYRVVDIADSCMMSARDVVAKLEHTENCERVDVKLTQKWPIKIPIKTYQERLLPTEPLTTKIRIVDAFFPLAEGGCAVIPGPFGSGKTVFQQSVARYADTDIVIIAACGERAAEIVETLREFSALIDPKTGRSLMERTIIICNTSSMPVAAREASIYTAMTIGEYYRQMGLRVLVLADSTSRWAQAIREMSALLLEIPTEDTYPAYLSSRIAAVYERAGVVRIDDKYLGSKSGSLTLIGTVSPAGGNGEDPVTESTLPVVGCFLGLTHARSFAQRFPAIAPLDSWSNYLDTLAAALDRRYFDGFVACIKRLKRYYAKGHAIADSITVVGEEDVSLEDFVHYLKAELFDSTFLQQNAFDDVDAGHDEARVLHLLKLVITIIDHNFSFATKDAARDLFVRLTAQLRALNLTSSDAPEYQIQLRDIKNCMVTSSSTNDLHVV